MHNQTGRLNSLVQKIAAPKIVVASILTFFAVVTAVNVFFRKDFNFLTQTFNYTPQYAYQLLNDIGTIGRQNHLRVLLP